jgi:hypothetical protein
MKTKAQQQRNAITADHAPRTDDEHISEEAKQQLKASDHAEQEANPGETAAVPAPESVRKGKHGHR